MSKTPLVTFTRFCAGLPLGMSLATNENVPVIREVVAVVNVIVPLPPLNTTYTPVESLQLAEVIGYVPAPVIFAKLIFRLGPLAVPAMPTVPFARSAPVTLRAVNEVGPATCCPCEVATGVIVAVNFFVPL